MRMRTAARAVIAACLLSGSGAFADPLPCQGRYSAISGDVTLLASGMVHVEPRNRSEGTVDLTYDGCDRITISGQGMRMDILRSATSGWSGTLTGGGATRVFRFNAVTPRVIESWMDAFGGGMTVQRGMKLTLLDGTENQPVDCIFDSDSQDFSRETFYGNRVREAYLTDGELNYRDVGFELPRNFRVLGALIADVTGDQQPEIAFIRNRRLYVYSGEQQIYKSNKEIGASIAGVTYDIDPAAQNPMITTAVCEVAPVAADLDGDGVKEIVAIGAEGTLLQAAGVTSTVDQSWLAVFKYQDGMMLKGTLGDKLERPIQGVAVVDGQAVMVATEQGSLLGDGQKSSYVLAVPVQ